MSPLTSCIVWTLIFYVTADLWTLTLLRSILASDLLCVNSDLLYIVDFDL